MTTRPDKILIARAADLQCFVGKQAVDERHFDPVEEDIAPGDIKDPGG